MIPSKLKAGNGVRVVTPARSLALPKIQNGKRKGIHRLTNHIYIKKKLGIKP